jgi:hypothetical protein
VNIDGLGWVWVPGTRWAPAWVSWRSGDGYYGWAPLPPDADEDDADYHFGDDVDANFDIGPGCYNFIPYSDFGAPNCSVYIVDRYRNYGIVGHTRNVTNFNLGVRGRAFGGAFAGGPALADVNSRSSRHVPTVRLAASNRAGRTNLNGNQLSVFAPRFNASTAHTTRPANVSRTISAATVNHGASIRDPLVVNSRVKPRAPTTTEIQQAAAAQTHTGVNHSAAANTGEPANTGEAVHHAATSSSTFHPEAANTGEPAVTHEAVSHTATSSSSFHAEEQTHNPPAPAEEHHTEEHNAPAPQAQHFTPAPAEEHHTEERSAPAPQAQHFNPAPQEQRSAPAPQAQHSAPAPAPHPGGGGGGGGKPGPGPNNQPH